NDYDLCIFNGEEGVITDVSKMNGEQELISIKFNDRTFDFLLNSSKDYNGIENENEYYEEKTMRMIKHSYALTIDKAQGSEWDFVIFYLDPGCGSNNLLNFR